MEPLFYVMAIMGCSDGGDLCQQARLESARYQNVAQCQAAMPDALARNTDLAFPVISAACQQSGMRMAANTIRTPSKGK